MPTMWSPRRGHSVLLTEHGAEGTHPGGVVHLVEVENDGHLQLDVDVVNNRGRSGGNTNSVGGEQSHRQSWRKRTWRQRRREEGAARKMKVIATTFSIYIYIRCC